MASQPPRNYLNSLTVLGVWIAVVSLGLSAVSLVMDFIGPRSSPYLGLLTFMVFPAFLFFGLALAGLGLILRRRRVRRGGPQPIAPLPAPGTSPAPQRLYLALAGTGLLILLLSAIGGYRAYEFTESVEFCGKTCHTVMEPEYVAHQASPHARVRCVECHVGSGAESYLKSKVNGLRQVISLLSDSYARPIPTPIENLRPAQETCEQCHWPEKFWGAQLSSRTRFGYDPLNTRREVAMLVKTGGGSATHGPSNGIHWHMNIQNRVEYVARDQHRMEIPWIASTSTITGATTVYVAEGKPPTAEELASLEHRRMDCMDCHNRPAHLYLSPEEGVDLAMESGKLDPGIPFLKEAAVTSLAAAAAGLVEVDKVAAEVEAGLREFYRRKDRVAPAAIADKIPAIAGQIAVIYRQNFFPRMKTGWSSYPSQIGHRLFPGCFRCHDNQHKSADGKVLRKDCDICHTFLARTPTAEYAPVSSSVAFAHPFKSEKHFEMECWACHSGNSAPYDRCGKCHEIEAGSPMAFACTGCHKPLKVKVDNGDCGDCHDPAKSKMHALKSHQNCIECHKEHDWKKPTYPDDCQSGECHKTLKPESHHAGEPCSPCHDFKGQPEFNSLSLRTVNPHAAAPIPTPAPPPAPPATAPADPSPAAK